MAINFIKQDLDDEGNTKYELPEKIAVRYIQSGFLVDLIALIPWGYIFESYGPNFGILWVIKAIRIKTLLGMMSNKNILPPIKMYITNLQKKSLEDEYLKFQMDKDSVNITLKIYLINCVKIVRLVLQTMMLAFFVGAYWFYFTYIVFYYHHPHDTKIEDEIISIDTFVYHTSHWDIINEPAPRKILLCMYFAFTSLSTVGFGDFYPVSDLERLLGSFVLLIGVAMFSYILGELLANVQAINLIESGFERQDDLDRFFSLLQQFNDKKPIEKSL